MEPWSRDKRDLARERNIPRQQYAWPFRASRAASRMHRAKSVGPANIAGLRVIFLLVLLVFRHGYLFQRMYHFLVEAGEPVLKRPLKAGGGADSPAPRSA